MTQLKVGQVLQLAENEYSNLTFKEKSKLERDWAWAVGIVGGIVLFIYLIVALVVSLLNYVSTTRGVTDFLLALFMLWAFIAILYLVVYFDCRKYFINAYIQYWIDKNGELPAGEAIKTLIKK